MKKGRHRRFEEARKLKQSGPGAFDLGFGERSSDSDDYGTSGDSGSANGADQDDYAELAAKYAVEFDDDEDDVPVD